MVSVLMTAFYLLAVVAALPAAFFVGHTGYKPEKFKNWRLARTCFVTMVAAMAGMFLLLHNGAPVADGWAAFILLSAVMFSLSLGMYSEVWMNRSPLLAMSDPDPVRYEETETADSYSRV